MPGSDADTQDLDTNEASPCSPEQARKLRPRLILYPSQKQFSTSRVLSSLRPLLSSPRRASASFCRLGFSSAEQLRHRIVAFPCLSGAVPPRELPPPILLWPTALRAMGVKKNLYSEARLRCEEGEGEEKALLKSSFEDGLKSAPMDLAARGHSFSLVGFVLQGGRFDLDSTSR